MRGVHWVHSFLAVMLLLTGGTVPSFAVVSPSRPICTTVPTLPGKSFQAIEAPTVAPEIRIGLFVANNPVILVDPSGEFLVPGTVIGGITGAISGGIGAWAAPNSSFSDIALGAAVGEVGGFAGGFIPGGIGSLILAGAAIGGVSDVFGQVVGGTPIECLNLPQFAGAVVGGGLSGLAGGTLNKLGRLAGDTSLLPDVFAGVERWRAETEPVRSLVVGGSLGYNQNQQRHETEEKESQCGVQSADCA